MPSELRISVIIPVHRGVEVFRRCMDGLTHSTHPPHEVLVVADGADNELVRVAEAHGARVLRHAPARGPAYARNRGAAEATGDILFFIDADVVVEPETVARVKDVFAQNPDLDALIGSYDDAPGAENFLSQYRNLLHHYVHQISDEDASTFWGACGAIKRDVFQRVGGFNEGYARPSIEDIELGYRLKQAGGTIKLCRSLQIKHLKRWSAMSILKVDVFHRALPWTELILQDRMFNNDLNLRHESRLSVVAIYVLLFALVGSFWWPVLLSLTLAMAVSLLAFNAPLYHFFYRKRGLLFTVKAVPWHWLFYLYSGLAFMLGLVRYLMLTDETRREQQVPVEA